MKRPLELPHAAEDVAMLEATWAEPRGFVGWCTHVDHKSIGRRYLVTAFVYFLIGGALAALMRLQLSRPDSGLIGPDLYNQIFTTHGTTMMFLFAVPVMQALGIYFVPLMVGARSLNTVVIREIAVANDATSVKVISCAQTSARRLGV